MNYKVLYRKYRPDCFENIVGQDYIIKTLQNSVLNNNISHAYIFSGPRGTGKTSTAKVFAKAINCLEPVNGSPCGKCEFCQNFQENPDIIEIDAASNNGVDEIRTLIDNIKLMPTNGKYKVYIIDEVHMLTTSAFNALLLTLEEPPSHTIFILATTNIENVPITILSRCQRFDFQKIKVEDIVKRLEYICDIENIKATPEALKEIAYLAEGGLRDALSLLDQLSKTNLELTLELIDKEVKTLSESEIIDLLNVIEDNDVEQFLEHLQDYEQRAIDYKSFVKKFTDVASNRAKNIKKSGNFRRLTFSDYKKIILELSDSITKININVEPYTILEMILLDYFNTDTKANEIAEIKEEKNIEEKPNNIVDNSSDEKMKELINIRINNCFVNVQKKYLEQIKNDINNYLNSINIDGKIKTILLDSEVVAASDTNLIFACSSEKKADTANKKLNFIEDALEKGIGKAYKIIFLSQNDWLKEKNRYIENLKNKIKYKIIPEPEISEKENIQINDVFEISKVEII